LKAVLDYKKLSIRYDLLLKINISSSAGLLSVEAVLLRDVLNLQGKVIPLLTWIVDLKMLFGAGS
jgi:hypothetical protein